MPVALNGWHPGEYALRSKLGPAFTSGQTERSYMWIDASMPDEHRLFYMRNVPFIPLTVCDESGRPWAAIASGSHQNTHEGSWVSSPSETELVMEVEAWEGDPILESLDSRFRFGNDDERQESRKGTMLAAGLGIEFPTRRRNKFAGCIERVDKTGPKSRRLHLRVNQAIGNCPKYINVRTFDQYNHARPQVAHRRLHMALEERLPPEMIEFIFRADTVFLATSYEANEKNKERYPSHVGMNARGGRPGFVRVRLSDARTLVLPDYSGNRLMTSLGNVEASSRAGMTFVDFETGDILYLTGMAKNLIGADALALMLRQNVLTTLHVEAFVFVRDALPVRQRLNTDIERSPYSPPIKFLTEEKEGQKTSLGDNVFVTLARVDILSPTLATFTFESDKPMRIRPGQAAVLDFTDLLGAPEYAHMAPGRETSLNDDRIRTWTVSFARFGEETNTFSLTMREKPGGLVTGALFALARHALAKMPAVLADARPLGLRIGLVGITGTFTFPSDSERRLASGGGGATQKLLWVAGGIGVTPFVAMLSAISSSSPRASANAQYDVTLILTTREPLALIRLIHDALTTEGHGDAQKRLNFLMLHMFIRDAEDLELDALGFRSNAATNIVIHRGRPNFSKSKEGTSFSLVPDITQRLVYLCGPPEFEVDALDALERSGVARASILREGFAY